MNIAVFGVKGRVGSRAAEIAKRRGHNVIGIDKGDKIPPDEQVDVVINFTTAEGTRDVAEFCLKRRCPLVNGATGLNDTQTRLLDELATVVDVISKPNFATGVDVMSELCKTSAERLKGWDCAIVETHRKGKKDAPSGTAKGLASVIAKSLGSFSSVETHALRLGADCGRHEVIFANEYESLTIIHQAYSIDAFALGAVRTAERVVRDKSEI